MKSFRFSFLLIFIYLFSYWSQFVFADSLPLRQAFVSTEKAFIWDRPGYSFKDCRGMDTKSFYTSDEDRQLTQMRYKSGGRDACENRQLLLEAGDEVMIVPTIDGFPSSKTKQVIIADELVDKKFYQVRFKDKKGNVKDGWISEDQISRVSQEQILTSIGHEAEKEVIEEPDCEPHPKKKPKKIAGHVLKLTDHDLKLPPQKSDNDIDYFMCLHRDASIDSEQFKTKMAQFRKAAKDAESDFKVPYALIMCTILDESGLRYNANENDEYIGYGQFGSALVDDLRKKIGQDKYGKMWTSYSRKNPSAKFTDAAIRRSNNPAAAVGAVALAMNWLYTERLPASGCKDCTSGDSLEKINKKDLFMMVAGYNFSPYSLGKMSKRGPSSFQRSYPPPAETRKYMTQMENCLSNNQEKDFRKKSADGEVSSARLKECKR